MINKIILTAIIILMYSCSSKMPDIQPKYHFKESLVQFVKTFIYELNKGKRLSRKTVKFNPENLHNYSTLIEKIITQEQFKYKYTLINENQTQSIAIEFQEDLQRDLFFNFDILISVKRIGSEIIFKAILRSNGSTLLIDSYTLPKRFKKRELNKIYQQLTYKKALIFCEKKGTHLPSIGQLKVFNIQSSFMKKFWSIKQNRGNTAIGFDFNKQQSFSGFKSDKFYTRCSE